MSEGLVITGGSGFVGSSLSALFAVKASVTLMDVVAPSDPCSACSSVLADVRDERSVFAVIRAAKPRCVIHTAALKDVGLCEAHPDEAHLVNVVGTLNVAKACKEVGAKMVYISTDWVFAGDKGDYSETDVPEPRSVYGKTKLMGEEVAQEFVDDLAICRSGGIYGSKSPLLGWLRSKLLSGLAVDCFADVYNSPTYVANLAEHIAEIIDRDHRGLFHTVGRERVNRYDFFTSFAKVFGLDETLLRPAALGYAPDGPMLLRDCSLSISQTAMRLQSAFNSTEEGLQRLKAESG